MAEDKLREAALKPIATIKKPVIAAEKKEETKAVEEKKEAPKAAKKTAAKKTTTAKKTATKATAAKTATKAAEKKVEEPKVAEEPKAVEEAKKPAAKKAAATKTTAKKTTTAAKKTTTAKKAAEKEDVKSMIVLQYADKEVTYSTLVDNAKNVFIYDMGGKEADIKTLDLYVKPEENKVYFVVNGEINGECQI